MAVVYRDANWGAQVGTAARQHDDKPSRHGATEPNHIAQSNPAIGRPPNRTSSITTSGAARSNRAIDCPTIEIAVELAEARDVTVVAVTTDQELRTALGEVLPKSCTIFANSPEQVLTRPVPNNCAVLIVEQTLSRLLFDQLKSHLKESAPALVSIMVGTDDNGSSLVARLSAGHIDRFMIKPFKLGPTRSALRSALQQHHSLLQCAQVERTVKPALAESALGATPRIQAPSAQGKASRGAQVHSAQAHAHGEKPSIGVVMRQPVVTDQYKPERHAQLNSDLRVADDFVEPLRETSIGRETRTGERTLGAVAARRFSLPAWSLAFAAAIAGLAVVALIVGTRTPELDKDKVIADQLAAAHRAFELGSYVDPPELSAAHFYSAALELDPSSVQARHGLEAVADQLIASGKELIVEGDLLRAQSTLDTVRRIQPNHRELAVVTALLLTAREAERVTLQAAHSATKENPEIITPAAIVAGSAQAARVVVAAPPVVARASVSTAPMTKYSSQRSEHQLQGASASTSTTGAVIAGVGVSSSSKSFEKMNDTNHTTAAAESSLKVNQASLDVAERTESRRLIEGPRLDATQNEAALLAAPKVASMPTNTGQISAGSVSIDAASTTEAPGSQVGNPMTTAANVGAKLVKYVAPVYPDKARVAGAEGWVVVHFLVTSNGSVINPEVENSSLEPAFRRAALAAVTQWKYSPAPTSATPNRPMAVRLLFQLADPKSTFGAGSRVRGS